MCHLSLLPGHIRVLRAVLKTGPENDGSNHGYAGQILLAAARKRTSEIDELGEEDLKDLQRR